MFKAPKNVVKSSNIFFYGRDPNEGDKNYEEVTYWISTEYTPYRVFVGACGKWKFIGKFYPEIV